MNLTIRNPKAPWGPALLSLFALLLSACNSPYLPSETVLKNTGPAAVTSGALAGIAAPVVGGTPEASITPTDQYTGTITWSPADATYGNSVAYTATIKLTAKPGFTLDGVTASAFSIPGATSVTYDPATGLVTAVFPATSAPPPTQGLTAPVVGGLPATTITPTTQYTGAITWAPVVSGNFVGTTAYTASIVLTAQPGQTLAGLSSTSFDIPGASSVTYDAATGVVTAVFPPTLAPVVSNLPSLAGVPAPVVGAVPPATITPTAQYTGAIAWSGSPANFAGTTSYTATITLTAVPGFTLDGLGASFFTIPGATSVTFDPATGVVTAVFPATAAPAVITIAAIPGVTVPLPGAVPATTITPTAQYTGTIAWSGSPATFANYTIYTATITLTAKPGFTLTGVTADLFTVAGSTTDTNPINSGVVTVVFPQTVAAVVSLAAIPGLTVPVALAVPDTTIDANAQYTAAVVWSPSPANFANSTTYTATITLTAKAGYTLTGVGANFFTVSGATSATNNANSGVVVAVFPATAAPAAIFSPAIPGVDVPTTGYTMVVTNTSTSQFTRSVVWAPTGSNFAATTVYTATITVTPKTGYTLTGVAANFFTVAGATTVTHSAGSGVVTAVFPATGAIPITAASVTGFVAPVIGVTPQAIGSLTTGAASYTKTSITWSPTSSPYASGTVYTATVVLTSAAGYKFNALTPTVNTGAASAGTVGGGDVSGNTLSFTVTFPATDTTINLAAIPGVTVPRGGQTAYTTIDVNAQYTGSIAWSGSPATFSMATIYTATITLTPKAGYTLTGVAGDLFTVSGSTSDTNSAGSGVVTAVFPATKAYVTYHAGTGNTSGTVPVDGTGYTSGSTVTVLGNPGTLKGSLVWGSTYQTFVGWNTQANGSGTQYTGVDSANVACATTFTITTSIDLYAQYTALRLTGPGNGLIFYDNGSTAGWGRYLESWTSDDAAGNVIWSNGSNLATSTAIGSGSANTALMSGTGTSAAATAVLAFSNGSASAGSWFIPSKDELLAMYNNLSRFSVGGPWTWTWSSSQFTASDAYDMSMSDANSNSHAKNYVGIKVRAVHAF